MGHHLGHSHVIASGTSNGSILKCCLMGLGNGSTTQKTHQVL
jgi:hypothetical protein